jgi:hypothetical protein
MKILVMGNINSGESGFIDEFLLTLGPRHRQRHGDDIVDGEMDTQSKSVSDVTSQMMTSLYN